MLTAETFMLPLFPGMTEEQQDYVIDTRRVPCDGARGGVKPTPLLIVGAGGFARETLELVHALNAVAADAGVSSGSWTTTNGCTGVRSTEIPSSARPRRCTSTRTRS